MIKVAVNQQKSLEDRRIWRTQPHVISVEEKYGQTIVMLDFDVVGTLSIEWKDPKPYQYQTVFDGLSGIVAKIRKAAHGGYAAEVDFSLVLPITWNMSTAVTGFTSSVYYLRPAYYRVTFDQDIDKIYTLALKD